MFRFFRSKKLEVSSVISNNLIVNNDEFSFLNGLILSLPSKYAHLIRQTNSDFILGKKNNVFGENGSYTFLIDQLKEKKLRKKSPYYQIKGIKIYNKIKRRFEMAELDILDEILVGYYAPSHYSEYDLNTIDSKEIFVKSSQILKNVENIVGIKNYKELTNYLNFNNVFEIEIGDQQLYTIHDYSDGNYIAVNKTGEIFGLFHDPFKIDLIFDNACDLIKAIKDKTFGVEDYFESSTS